MDLLLKILLDANKDLKINDQIIYNKLDLYQFEADKRKFYQLLVGTELFATQSKLFYQDIFYTAKMDMNFKNGIKEIGKAMTP